jgi:hypothetical protein
MSAQISNDEFQFYKTNLTKQVKEYLEIDDQIAALNKAIKDRRKRKKDLSEDILNNMKNIDIHYMNVKDGKLVYNVTNSKQGLTKKTIMSGLQLYFNNDEQRAMEAANMILENRKRVEKVSLKYTKVKKGLTINNA